MIHYHGSPLGGTTDTNVRFFSGRHAFISFADSKNLDHIQDVVSSFALDNGAFSFWKKDKKIDWLEYYKFVDEWRFHPAFDWAVIPDVIDGGEEENDELLKHWPFDNIVGVPVWHLHESFNRLHRLADEYPRICIGSSGEYAHIGTTQWWDRMDNVFLKLTDGHQRPYVKVHGLRMLDPEVFGRYPFASCDSTNVARNITNKGRWQGTYNPISDHVKALVMADRIEVFQSPKTFSPVATQRSLFDILGTGLPE